MADKIKLSKFVKNMEFMKRGLQRKREREEQEKAENVGEILDMTHYLHTKQTDDGGFLTTDSNLLCMDLKFGRFSYHNTNPEIEKLMALNNKNDNQQDKEAEDEIDVSREEMARVLSNKRRRHHR